MSTPRSGTVAEPLLEQALTAAAGLDGWAAHSAELDAAEEFPAELCARLDDFGLHAYYVPAEWGGALDDHESLLRLWRTVARRDMSVAVAHGKTYLGAASVWVGGSSEQAAATAAAVLAGTRIAWALSEPDHGADLLHGEVAAESHPGGYRLRGTKWPVNNATRGDRLAVLARTGASGRARGHSILLVDKDELEPGTWRTLPKVLTHGIRGIDISGVEFLDAPVPASALVGPEGSGVETVLRALQLTRTMCAALSLGAGEHALRLAADFTATRLVQRRPLIDRPHPAAVLARGTALLAAVEAAALVACRSIHALTAEMSVTSAVVKSLAPTLVDATIVELAELLGVRSFLTEAHEHGEYQKLWRDHQIVAVFDGSTPVNRAGLAHQFPRLARAYAAADFDADGVAEAVAVGVTPRPLDPRLLTLMARRGCSVVQALPGLIAGIPEDAPEGVAHHAAVLGEQTAHVTALMAGFAPAALPPAAAYEVAAAYELCYAGAACLHLWTTHAADRSGEPLWQDGLWVRAALRALTVRLGAVLRTEPPAAGPGDETLDVRLAGLAAYAAATGAAITPFGAPTKPMIAAPAATSPTITTAAAPDRTPVPAAARETGGRA